MERRMRVLQIDVNCKQSSTGKIVYDLYSYGNSHGAEMAVCYGRGPALREKNIYKFGLDGETYLHALLTRLTGRTGCYSFFSTRRLLRFIKRFRPDVIHLHELHAYFVDFKPLLRFIAENEIPVVWTFHCEFMYTGKCGYANDCMRFTENCGRCTELREYPKTLFFDRTAKMLDEKKRLLSKLQRLIVATPSKWLADRVKLSFLKDRRVELVYNGIDTTVFCPRNADALRNELKISREEKVILSVAPDIMSERKGGSFVLQLAERFRGERVKFVLVGVKNCAVPHADNVILIPPVSDQIRLAQFYSMADLFVICSHKENFPTTCLEAQCCGTSVCGFATGGTTETCIDGTENFVEFGDVGALADVLRKNLSELPDRTATASEAKNRFSYDTMSEKYFAFYRELLAKQEKDDRGDSSKL